MAAYFRFTNAINSSFFFDILTQILDKCSVDEQQIRSAERCSPPDDHWDWSILQGRTESIRT